MALWGGRFNQGPAESVFALSRSVHFDYRLAPYDLRSSLAHLSVLESSGMIGADDAKQIAKVLRELLVEVTSGNFGIEEGDEDIHSALERAMMQPSLFDNTTMGFCCKFGRKTRSQDA